ncbi:hypothetical protein D1872_251760 [compost metagenome]
MLEEVLPYPPFFVGIGEWRDAFGFQLGDGFFHFGCRSRECRDPGFLKQFLVIYDREKVAFHRQTEHLAVAGTHVGANGVRHGCRQRFVGQVGAVFGVSIDVPARGRLEYVRRAACRDSGFQYGVVVGLHNFQIDRYVRLHFFIFFDVGIKRIRVFRRSRKHVDGDLLVVVRSTAVSSARTSRRPVVGRVIAAASG